MEMKKTVLGNKGFTLGELLMIIAIAFLILAVLEPPAREIHEKEKRVECANNLREFGKALYLYAKDNQGKFPDTLKTLYDGKYLVDQALADCPATKGVGTPEAPDYVYNRGLGINSPSEDVLVQDDDGNHKKGKNVLLVDGEIIWVLKNK